MGILIYPFFKRAMDFVIAVTFLVVSLPFWPIIALVVKLDSRGPVFYAQRRVGKEGRLFSLLKFRSMVRDAEPNGPAWSDDNDRRITRAGRILRRLHVDELPQLLNVLKGDMSVVGPRPERPELVEAISRAVPEFSRRHAVNPGLTGWAQVNYRYAASVEDSRVKLAYDLEYIDRIGFGFDLRILARTFGAVLKMRE